MEALQNAKPDAVFLMKKWFWYKKYGPGGLWRTIFWSKPALYQTRANVFRTNPGSVSMFKYCIPKDFSDLTTSTGSDKEQ
jgi:hypothetical protein